MIGLLLILLFGKTILLNPTPVTISDEWLEIRPEKEFSLISGNPGIRIDITHNIKKTNNINELKKKFPAGTVTGVLITTGGEEIAIRNTDFIYSNGKAILVLRAKGVISTRRYGKKFSMVKIKSKNEMVNANVYWRNY